MFPPLRSQVDKQPRRPLLGRSGVAATTAHRYIKRNRNVGEKITVTNGSVQNQAMGPVLVQTPAPRFRAPKPEDRVRELERLLCEANRECTQWRQSHSILQEENNNMKKMFQQKETFLKVSVADAHLMHQKTLKSVIHLKTEKSKLKKWVNKLRFREQELEQALDQSLFERDKLHMEYEQQQDAHSALLLENKEMKKELIHKEQVLKEYEQQQDAHSALLLENEEMKKELIHKEEVLKVSLTDAELKHEKALESISQLEEEKSELTKQVDKLRDTVEELGEELCNSHLQSDELQIEYEQQQDAHSALLLENEEMKKELIHKEEVLKVSLADAELKHEKALESISQLEEEKSELTKRVDKLRYTVQELGELLCNCHLQIDELQIEYEQQQDAHSALLLEYEEMKKELIHTEEVLKVSLADAELKHQKALESISQLEEEKSELTKRVNKLRYTVEELGEQLCNTHLQIDELQIDCEQQYHANADLNV